MCILECFGSGDAWNKEIDRILWVKEKCKVLSGDMESIGVYTAATRLKVPVLGIRVMSDNELLNESYERDTAAEAQKIALEITKKYIGAKK